MNNNVIIAIRDLSSKLRYMIKDLANYYGDEIDEFSSLKVRPGYGYDKFYLDWVEGSYDMSLQSLINFMLQDHHHYQKLLSKETYKKVTKFNKQNPGGIYDFGDNEAEQDIIDHVQWTVTCAVRNFCREFGFSDKSFLAAGYDNESILPHISSNYLVDTTIIFSSTYGHGHGFYRDLKNYIKKNEITQDDKDKIIEVVKESGDNIEIATLLFPKYPELAEIILKLAIKHCTKKSECTALAINIKQLGASEELLKELETVKSKL